MKFIIQADTTHRNFVLYYRYEDHSFDIEPFEGGGTTSIMVNDLQLEIDDNGKIIYVWGYCPLVKYKQTNEFPENHKLSALVALLDKPPVPGVSYRLNESERWPIYINKQNQWICVGDPKMENKKLIEFAPNCIATMDGQELIAIWLHPNDFPYLS
jgi:hypothetical protein